MGRTATTTPSGSVQEAANVRTHVKKHTPTLTSAIASSSQEITVSPLPTGQVQNVTLRASELVSRETVDKSQCTHLIDPTSPL